MVILVIVECNDLRIAAVMTAQQDLVADGIPQARKAGIDYKIADGFIPDLPQVQWNLPLSGTSESEYTGPPSA